MIAVLYPFCIFFLFLSLTCHSQTIVGMGTETPNPNAVLDLVSANGQQGFLVPRLTTAQRIASSFVARLSDQDNGLLVFDMTEGYFYFWQNGSWQIGFDQTDTAAFQQKTLPANQLWVGNTSGVASPVSISGDVTLNSNGTMTITLDAVSTAKILNDAVTKEKVNADVAGDGLGQDADGRLRINVGSGLQLNADQLSLTRISSGQLLVGQGNSTDIAAKSVSGDVSLDNNGKATVQGLQGYPVSTTTPATDQVLTWNGSAWTPVDNITQNGKRMNGQLNVGAESLAADRKPGMLWLDSTGLGSIKRWTGSAWEILLAGFFR